MVSAESRHKPELLEAATALREVHKVLVRAVRFAYEKEEGKQVGGPGHLLRLLTEDPYFAWLHPMSELIVDLDSLLAQELLPQGTVAAVKMEINRLARAGGPFWEKYAPFLQSDPQVAVAHGRLRQAINALPEVAKEGLHERKAWVTPRVHTKRNSRS